MSFNIFANASDDHAIDPFSMDRSHEKKLALQRLESANIPVFFGKASEIVNLLNQKKLNILSKKGYAQANQNRIYISDFPNYLKQAKIFIHSMDHLDPEILIKAKIVNIDSNYSRDIGVLFRAGNHDHLKTADGFTIDFPIVTNQLGSFNFPLIRVGKQVLLEMELNALEEEGHAETISAPKLLTMNHHRATIEAGEEIPYQESTVSGATSVTFKKAVLRLQVTPSLLPHHNILLHLKVNQDKVSSLSVNNVPAIRTQQIETTIFVKQKQTVVLGGILEYSFSTQQERIPIISRIPIIGHLFQNQTKIKKKKELLIFITPSIASH